MKRLSTALAPTLMTGALLGISAVSQAQSNILGFLGDVPEFVTKGSVISLIGTLTRPDSEAGVESTTVQSIFRFDARYFDVVATLTPMPAGSRREGGTPVEGTFQVASGPYAGTNSKIASVFGIIDTTTDPENGGVVLSQGFQFIRYDLTVKSTAGLGGFSEFGYSNAVITSPTLAAANRSLYFTTARNNTTFAGSNQNKPGAFRVGIVPGPSSLAVFALGGLAPAMALLRRRRVAK
jgi:hypothetical protein